MIRNDTTLGATFQNNVAAALAGDHKTESLQGTHSVRA